MTGDLSNFEKRLSDTHFVFFLFYYDCKTDLRNEIRIGNWWDVFCDWQFPIVKLLTNYCLVLVSGKSSEFMGSKVSLSHETMMEN